MSGKTQGVVSYLPSYLSSGSSNYNNSLLLTQQVHGYRVDTIFVTLIEYLTQQVHGYRVERTCVQVPLPFVLVPIVALLLVRHDIVTYFF